MAACAIWGTPAQELASSHEGRKLSSDRAGGTYRITGSAMTVVDALSPADKAKLTTWLIDQRRSGETDPMISTETVRTVQDRRALRLSERKERFFLYVLSRDFQPSDFLRMSGPVDADSLRDQGELTAWTECRSERDTSALVGLLTEEGLLTAVGGRVKLSAKGFERMEALESGSRPSRQAFVAMWFSHDLAALYDQGIAPAIVDAGYVPLRIDRKEHGNKIDDEIIAEIRRSRFVVADFTCSLVTVNQAVEPLARGGVYYEAGFAQGLGIPVIWTCRADCIEHTHFDTRQFNHIVWNDPEDLRGRLLNRIRAVIL